MTHFPAECPRPSIWRPAPSGVGEIDNRLYERRFLRRMCERMIATGRYTKADFRGIRSIFEIDDKITAPSFGFRSAEHYYATQSANQFLERIRIPTLVVQAQDDTFIPFEIFPASGFRIQPPFEAAHPPQRRTPWIHLPPQASLLAGRGDPCVDSNAARS